MELDAKLKTNSDTIIEQLRDIKTMAKLPTGSNYAIKRLQLTGEGSVVTKEYNKKMIPSDIKYHMTFLWYIVSIII